MVTWCIEKHIECDRKYVIEVFEFMFVPERYGKTFPSYHLVTPSKCAKWVEECGCVQSVCGQHDAYLT